MFTALKRRWCGYTTVRRTTPSAMPRARWALASSTTATKMPNWPTSSWPSAATRTRPRPTTSWRTGCQISRAHRRQEAEVVSRRGGREGAHHLCRPAANPTIAICEKVAGPDNVLHLDIEPGTDIALFNGFLTYVVEQGWHDKDFIAQYTRDFDVATSANKLSLEEASQITGVPVAKLQAGRRVGLQAKGRRVSAPARCTPMRRALSGATTITLSSRRSLTWCWPPATSEDGELASCGWAGTRRATRGRRTRATRKSTSTRKSSRVAGLMYTAWAYKPVPDHAQRRAAPPGHSPALPVVKEAMGKARGASDRADGRHRLRRGEEQGTVFSSPTINLYPTLTFRRPRIS